MKNFPFLKAAETGILRKKNAVLFYYDILLRPFWTISSVETVNLKQTKKQKSDVCDTVSNLTAFPHVIVSFSSFLHQSDSVRCIIAMAIISVRHNDLQSYSIY